MTDAGSASPPPPASAPQAKDVAVAALVLNAAAAAAIAADAEDGERLPADPAPTPAVPDGRVRGSTRRHAATTRTDSPATRRPSVRATVRLGEPRTSPSARGRPRCCGGASPAGDAVRAAGLDQGQRHALVQRQPADQPGRRRLEPAARRRHLLALHQGAHFRRGAAAADRAAPSVAGGSATAHAAHRTRDRSTTPGA